MRVIGTVIILATIMAIEVAGLDVSCEVTDDLNIVSEFYAAGKTICYFKDGTEIHEPSKLTNSMNEKVTQFFMTRLEKVEFLPQDLSVSFPNLEKINAKKCSVKGISKLSFHGLTKVTEIALSANQIETIDENSFEDLQSLRQLNLGRNKITNLSAKLFANLANLDTLYLNNNSLTTLDADLFKNNIKITAIFLDSNELQTLPSGIFDALTNMNQLSLELNKIVDLPPHIFDNCKSLWNLALHDNEIETIDSRLLSKLDKLEIVHFSLNPLSFIDFVVFHGNPNLEYAFFVDVNTTDIRNIDYVYQLKKIKQIKIGKKVWNSENLDELKMYT